MIAFQQGEKAFFIHGFAKNERSNVSGRELRSLKSLAKELLGYPPAALADAMEAGELTKLEID